MHPRSSTCCRISWLCCHAATACPYALALAIPIANLVCAGLGAEPGILVESAESLEIVFRIQAVISAQTARLPLGEPLIPEVQAVDLVEKNEVVRLATVAT
jgi:Cu+-exporting ATPase